MKQLYLSIIILFSLIGITGCLDDPEGEGGIINGGIPELAEVELGEKTATSIFVSGEITKKNGVPVTEYGFVWTKVRDGVEGKEEFIVVGMDNEQTKFSYRIEGLEQNSEYKVRAYAINKSERTGYSDERMFATTPGIGVVCTLQPDSIRGVTALAGGKIEDRGEGEIIKRGVYLLDSKKELNKEVPSTMQTDSFTCLIEGLAPLTEYYIVAFVENGFGIFTGDTISLITGDGLPVIRILEIMPDYTKVEFTLEISDIGDSEIIEKGILWSETGAFGDEGKSEEIIASGNTFNVTIGELVANKVYYARAYAINKFGEAFSNDTLFSTRKDIPTVVTNEIDLETLIDGTVIVSGNVLDEGKNPPVIAAGICWTTNSSLQNIYDADTINLSSGTGYFEGMLTGLKGGREYFIRAFAVTNDTVAYGDMVKILTPVIFHSKTAPSDEYGLFQNSAASFTAENKGYLLGGDLGSGFTDVLQMYDPLVDRWIYKQAPFRGGKRKYQSAAYNGDLVYILGGLQESEAIADDFYWYNIKDNTYGVRNTIAKPDPLFYAASLSLGTDVCYIGGNKATNISNISNEVWLYDSDSENFIIKTSFPVNQYGGIAVMIDDVVYAGLGITNSSGTSFTRQLWSSTKDLDYWTYVDVFPGNKVIRGGVALDKVIYVIDSDLYIWAYDTQTADGWKKKSKVLTNNQSVYCMWVLNDMIFIGVGDVIRGNQFYRYDPVWDN